MILYHATPTDNLLSIRREGLLAVYAQTARKCVWLHTATRSPWAAIHTAARHTVSIRDILILKLVVVRGMVRRAHGKGLWRTVDGYEGIPPWCIDSAFTATALDGLRDAQEVN